ncbi:MAG: peptidase [Rhodospirillaceae bacterium]|nr:peptidase [Rhodospirillaceae bacterium]|tara:strand:+ start:115877 stop:117145 length:1269 start_codon:yes stop_codon:yes gene_type:complete
MSNFGRAIALSAMVLAAPVVSVNAAEPAGILNNYADIAHAGYEDSLITAKTLDAAIDDLIATPTADTLAAARQAWLDARVPYQQTEAYRFGNAIVDDWEGRVNAWPLDEGLIDYVDPSYGMESDQNPLYTVNVIANPKLKIAGQDVDATDITPDLLSGTLQEAGGVEANVATGYHAIEFLLWGQDLNGTGPGAGTRPASDYDTQNCTNGNCDRRAEYLKAASTLLIADLQEMVGNWEEGGAARAALLENPDAGLLAILTGMGSLSYGELAGERIKLGLLLHDPEEEHDCFSDNTHNSHYYDQQSIRNVYLGQYTRVDGTVVSGPSISDLVAENAPAVDEELRAKLDATVDAMEQMRQRVQSGEAYDQMIGEGNEAGNAIIQAVVDGLVAQTRPIERAVAELNLGQASFEGSDSLDNPNAVFQ